MVIEDGAAVASFVERGEQPSGNDDDAGSFEAAEFTEKLVKKRL
jgi:hypothetical protein